MPRLVPVSEWVADLAQRGDRIFVATSNAAEKALPAGSGRGRKGISLSELIDGAK